MPTRIGGSIPLTEPRGTNRGIAPPRTPTKPPTKPPPPSVKPPPPNAPRRTTLVGDAGDMPDEPLSSTAERPAIVVPPASAMQPKAVTQPPPWGEGRVQLGVPIPAPPGTPSMRAREDSAEEISASVFLTEDDDLDKTRQRGPVVEEMSGSLLLPDESGKAPAFVEHGPASAPTKRGHAPLTSPITKTKESPQFPSAPPLASKPPGAPHMSAPPPPFPAVPVVPPSRPPPAVAPTHAAAPPAPPAPPASSPHAATPHAATPHAPPAVTTTAPMPIVSAQAANAIAAPHAAASAPPVATPAPPVAQPDAPMTFDASLPEGVPVPPPPPEIVHPNWPPPHIEPAVQPSAAAPALPSPAPLAPPPAPRLESTDRFITTLGSVRDRFFAHPLVRRVSAHPFVRRIAEHPTVSRLVRERWFLPVVIGGGVIITIGLLGLVVSLFSGSSDDSASAKNPAVGGVGRSVALVATSVVAAGPIPASSPSTPAPAAPVPPSNAACVVGGGSHVVAPRAVIAAGVEVAALEGGIAVGFAPADKEGMAVLLDPSLSATSNVHAKSADPVRRLTPSLGAHKSLATVVDADKKADRIHGRRFVAGDPGIDVGAIGGSLVAGSHGTAAGTKLWTIPGDGAVDAVRGVAFTLGGEKAYAIAFRRGTSIYAGVAAGDPKSLAAKGGLSKMDGLGEKIGSPAIAVTGDDVMVAWADRKSDTDAWSLRYVVFKAGAEAPAPKTFSVPAGGLGENVMSPGLIGLVGARFLVVWTEGPVDNHQVRGQTLRADGGALGAALAISAEGVHAGQGQAAVAGDGKGVVAFLDGAKREVVATPITCP
jgi:hypothetical protein